MKYLLHCYHLLNFSILKTVYYSPMKMGNWGPSGWSKLFQSYDENEKAESAKKIFPIWEPYWQVQTQTLWHLEFCIGSSFFLKCFPTSFCHKSDFLIVDECLLLEKDLPWSICSYFVFFNHLVHCLQFAYGPQFMMVHRNKICNL